MFKNFSLVGFFLFALVLLTGLKPSNISIERSRCSNYIDIKTDTITGSVRLMAKDRMKLIDKDGKMLFNMMMIKHDKEITLHFKGIKPVCFSTDTKVVFEFTDDTQAEIKSSNQDNCKGVMSLNMGGIYGEFEMIKKLGSSTIRNITFGSKKDSFQIDLDIDQKERILNTLDCFIYS